MDEKISGLGLGIAEPDKFVPGPLTSVFEKVETHPSAVLVITTGSGTCYGVVNVDEKGIFPRLLAHYAALGPWDAQEEPDGAPVIKLDNTVVSLGQDTYAVKREFLLFSRSACTSVPFQTLREWEKSLPSFAVYHVVVSY